MARPWTTDRRDHLERRGARDAAALGPPALLVAGVGVALPGSCWPAPTAIAPTPRSPPSCGCNPVTVGKWRHRFAADRLDGLVDAPRPGAARTIGDDVVEAIVVETLETAPPDATHWSTRGLAAKHGISHTTVRRDLAGVRAQAVAPGRASRSPPTLIWSRRSATSSRCT